MVIRLLIGLKMGQSEIYELLKTKRLSGDNSYYSVSQIQKMLNGKGLGTTQSSINNSLTKLRMFGYLDMRLSVMKVKRATYPFSEYRLRKEYVE